VEVREIRDFDTLSEEYRDDWQRLCEQSPHATIFQTWEWMQSWWRFHHKGKRLRVLILSDAGRVVGIAPFFIRFGPLRVLQLLGTGGSDYLDLLAESNREADVVSHIAQFLQKNKATWDWADLQQVKPNAVATQLSGARVLQGETCPYLPLESSYELLLKSLGKKLRQNIGYYARALEKQYMVTYRLADAVTLTEDLEAFFELHQRRWNSRWMPGAFSSRQARAFHTAVAHAQLASGRLRLHTLLLDGTPQASLYAFHHQKTTYYYLGGFEPTLAKLSLGTVLTAHAIHQAIEQDHATEFDFLRGNEGYKYKWSAKDRYNQRVSLERSGLVHAMHAKHGGAGKKES
jgi:CelD/BcsL family acetyltransferase involved in cellulose biosynthesis